MTVFARFEVIPVHEGSHSTDIARAVSVLDDFDVAYETTATDTVIEADTVGDIFEAARAAHDAVPGNRVITSLEIEEQRGRTQRASDRVAAVERELGHSARRDRPEWVPGQGERRSSASTPRRPAQATSRGGRGFREAGEFQPDVGGVADATEPRAGGRQSAGRHPTAGQRNYTPDRRVERYERSPPRG